MNVWYICFDLHPLRLTSSILVYIFINVLNCEINILQNKKEEERIKCESERDVQLFLNQYMYWWKWYFEIIYYSILNVTDLLNKMWGKRLLPRQECQVTNISKRWLFECDWDDLQKWAEQFIYFSIHSWERSFGRNFGFNFVVHFPPLLLSYEASCKSESDCRIIL